MDGGRLWAGGAATAVVAALIALVGVLIGEGLFDLQMVEPPVLPVGGSFAVRYAVTAAVLALVATGIGHLLGLTTPRPGCSSAGSSAWSLWSAWCCRSPWTGRSRDRWPRPW